MTWQDEYSEKMLPIFGSPRLELVRGQGPWVWDSDGKKYLDLLAGIAVNSVGQAHPAVVKAVTEQLQTLGHVSNFFTTPPQLALATELLRLADAPDGKVLLVNSGAEANEAALKIALRNKPGGRMIALDHAFHGRTLGSLSITWKAAYREPFEPMTGNATFLPPEDIAALQAELERGDVAAVFLEPIQGEAGVHELSADYLQAARELTRQHGALLVVDEVQSGSGRTGDWFAHTAAGITPDVITMAKGLAGGFPIGAVLAIGEAAGLLQPGQHGTTFGGNPVAAAAALAVVGIVEPLMPGVAELGERWKAELAAVPGVTEVRGRGLILGLELEAPSADVAAALQEEGVIVNAPTASAIRIVPPLNLTDEQAGLFTVTLSRVLAGLLSQQGETN